MNSIHAVTSHRQAIPADLLAELRATGAVEVSDAEVRKRLADDGYLYLTNAIDRDEVIDARREVMARLVEVGEIREPAVAGISTGTSRRAEAVDDLGAFWKSVSEGKCLRRVTHGPRLAAVMARIFATAVRPFDFLWLRATRPGGASAYHFDHVYMNRGTDRLLTVWIPLGDVPREDGPLAIVEGSHRWGDLIAAYRGFDVDRDRTRPGHVTTEPVNLLRERHARLLTTDFRAGDVVVLSMFALHGSLDNRSMTDRVRLSCDVRYQPADDPFDERWIGDDPVGHGRGYGSMSAAQPATAKPIFR
ncbi:MAG: phytanoyl-CoA dioxygenase family protein [Planctomycetales bacterium]|nr:phytanoyl-CoA dioxygenase family protein [Planctomycetales bacterium]